MLKVMSLNKELLIYKLFDQVQAYMTQIDDTDLDASITRIQNVSMELYGNIQKLLI